MPHPRTLAIGLLLLVCTLAVPLAVLALTPGWYLQNCQWHDRCTRIGEPSARQHIENLRDYFLHRDDLRGAWSDKERSHLSDVRQIYELCAKIAAAAMLALMVGLLYRPAWILSACQVNFAYILSLLAILPVFGYVWHEVLHPLLFSNSNWLTNPADITWHITPRVFFRNSLVAVVAMAMLLNLGVYAISRWCTKTQR